jgi:hypothetical protein
MNAKKLITIADISTVATGEYSLFWLSNDT